MIASISFTTYSNKVEFAEKSLHDISLWKNENYELLVACHDPSKQMKNLLSYYQEKKTINKLFFTPTNYGHLKGVNLCLKKSKGKFFFNINHDILIKTSNVIDDCIDLLKIKENGMIGWFWIGKGCFWKDNKFFFNLRNKEIKKNKFFNDPSDLRIALEKNKINETRWFWCCNTSFFGIKTKLFKQIKGFNTIDFKHEYADDYLTYKILEKKLNVIDLPRHIYDNEDIDSMTRCTWHDLGLKLAKKESRPFNYLVKLL